MARVLLVEDEAQILLLAESVLQQIGHDTLSVGTVAKRKHTGDKLCHLPASLRSARR
jgi:CheY-like chemotaxis protein